jgi:valyl-tRNA synthetase
MEDLAECPECAASVRQDEDVLDTWFSSQLWPFATLGWPDETPELGFFYPTSVLSTARDIIFLWVARMIMSGLYFVGDVPYEDVIIHPTVFNREGRRMSKSLGTGVDPLDLIADYGADGMRFGLMLQTTGNQDIRFTEEKLASSRNFANKIWNASRFVLMNVGEDFEPGPPSADTVADRWILSRLAELGAVVDEGLAAYQFGETARALYHFLWSEFCDWYIELSKDRLAAGGEGKQSALRNLVYVLDRALRLLHPMMPFITEDIWRRLPLSDGEGAEALMVAQWPTDLAGWRDEGAETSMQILQETVTALRAVRARFSVPPRTPIDVVARADGADKLLLEAEEAYLAQLAGVGSLSVSPDAVKPAYTASDVIKGIELFVPLEGLVDIAAERERVKKELARVEADLAKAAKKLSNEGFLSKAAPEIVEKERAKQGELADAEQRLASQLAELAD